MTLRLEGYTELRTLGEGATGRVVLARHEPTQRMVAIKFLSPELSRNEAFLARFRAEARLLQELSHPNIVGLWGYVEHEGEAALIMELVEGVTLRTMLEGGATAAPEAALTVLKGSLLGLDRAHRAGVVHRDYKPDNVLVDGEGTSRLVDFGIAVRVGEDGGRAGTPAYMAPEQWAQGTAGPATDVYAATAVFYECLVGRTPYAAADLAAWRAQHELAPIPDGAAPAPVRGLISRGLAKESTQRYSSAAEFLAELEERARAGYGADWAERGGKILAGSALGLAALFPLAAMVSGGGGAATASSGITAVTQLHGGAAAAGHGATTAAGHGAGAAAAGHGAGAAAAGHAAGAQGLAQGMGSAGQSVGQALHGAGLHPGAAMHPGAAAHAPAHGMPPAHAPAHAMPPAHGPAHAMPPAHGPAHAMTPPHAPAHAMPPAHGPAHAMTPPHAPAHAMPPTQIVPPPHAMPAAPSAPAPPVWTPPAAAPHVPTTPAAPAAPHSGHPQHPPVILGATPLGVTPVSAKPPKRGARAKPPRKPRRRRRAVIAICGGLAILGCGGGGVVYLTGSPGTAASPAPTGIPAVIALTSPTPTPSVEPLATDTPAPTATPAPTDTPTPSATPVITVAPASTSSSSSSTVRPTTAPPTHPPTPTAPPCTPSIPSTISYTDNTGSHTRGASSYSGNTGSWSISEPTAPQGTRVTVSISGMVSCGGQHHALTVTDHSGNYSCYPTQGSSVSTGINTYGPPPETVSVTVSYGSGC